MAETGSRATLAASVDRHYGRADLLERLLARLNEVGLDVDRLTAEDLKPVDQFHIGGAEATEALAQLAGITRDDAVLDIGCGIGGPARWLADRVGCSVVGIDVTQAFCMAARELNRRTGLAGRVTVIYGSATELPLADRQFDVVWMQHVSMNIEDKSALYREAARVLRPGGRIVAHEILRCGDEPIRYPVPWAREEAISFLASESELRGHLEDAGFAEESWMDVSSSAIEFFQQMQAAHATGGPPALSISTLMGEDFPELAANVMRNLIDGRIAVVRVICKQYR